MWIYLRRRLLHSSWVLIAILVGAFLLIRLIPGDPVIQMLGIQATPETIASVTAELGLDKPIPQQFIGFVSRAVQGDLGDSFVKRAPVREIILDRVMATLYLLLYSTVVALLIAIPLGALSAIHANRPIDQVVRLVSMITFAMPQFWLGLMLILVLSINLGWFPSGGYQTGALSIIKSLTLPSLTIGLFLAPQLMRTLRSSLIEQLESEYIVAARSFGFSEARIVGRYALRNALVPLISVLSINIGFLISGTVIVEAVFQLPGLGALLVQSVLNRDFPVIQGLVIVFGVMVIAVNILADLSYAAIDPRIRQGASAT